MFVIVNIVFLLAGNFFMNGFLHLMMGLLGKRFVKRPKMVSERQYEKVYRGRLFSSTVFNTVYGLGQIVVVILVLASVDGFRFGLTLGTGMLILGAISGAMLLAWKYEGTIA